jgi:hypothetical protein
MRHCADDSCVANAITRRQVVEDERAIVRTAASDARDGRSQSRPAAAEEAIG